MLTRILTATIGINMTDSVHHNILAEMLAECGTTGLSGSMLSLPSVAVSSSDNIVCSWAFANNV